MQGWEGVGVGGVGGVKDLGGERAISTPICRKLSRVTKGKAVN